MRRSLLVACIVASTLTLRLSGAQSAPQQAPAPPASADAADLKRLDTICGGCHTRGSIVGTHRTTQDWKEVLEWMADEGAVMSDEEFGQILAYLSVRAGRVNINTAPGDEIARVLELTGPEADRIVAARAGGRQLATTMDVATTARVPVAQIEARKARITFGE